MTAVFDMNSPELRYLCDADNRLARVINKLGPLKCETFEEPFCFLVQTIIGQMLSARVADVIAARLHNLCGGSVTPGVLLALPDEALTGIGLSRAKAAAVRSLAQTAAHNPDFLDRLEKLPDDAVQQELTRLAVSAIGPPRCIFFSCCKGRTYCPLRTALCSRPSAGCMKQKTRDALPLNRKPLRGGPLRRLRHAIFTARWTAA